jgi:diguanylate cyclase (GGDEF)-like protein
MALGIFLGVWSAPDKLATVYLCFLICSLLMFINPPWFNLCLTLASMIFFMVFTLIFKTTENAIYDIVDTVIAGVIGLYFGWQISKLRMGLEISTTMLEEERNKYLDQSTVDELTKLKNRRDFMQTFQRYLSNYRTSDDWLCVSISDIDFFKFYNDHYGHPKGDECLRSIGAAFNKLRDDKNVYVARIGGEEFGMLWFEKEMSHADTVVKYMAELVKELKIPHEKSKIAEHVTMSMGVYIERCGASTDVKALYDLADKALYAAKEGGRNCIIITGRETEQYKITPEQ